MLLGNRFTHDSRVERESRSLAAAGHEVRVFCLSGEGLPAEGSRDGYAFRRVEPPAWISWTGPRRIVPLLRWFSRYRFLAAAAEPWRPEVVHGHDLEMLLPAGLLAERLGVPLVHDDHELGLEKIGQGTETLGSGWRKAVDDALVARLRRRGAALEARFLPRAAAVLAGSPLYASTLEARYGRPVVPLLNVPWTSDRPPDPRLRERAGLPPGSRIVLYQGTVTPGGGGQQCIEAARTFPAGWHLVFLGVTWMRSRLEEQARAAGLLDRVRFLDPVPPSELPGFTAAADAGLAPIRPVNLGQAYSMANKLFEYLHAGIPVIASDIPDQAAFVRSLDAGIVLEEVTPESVAGAVSRLAAVPEGERVLRRDRLRAAARSRYCWEIESRGLLDAYRAVLEPRGAAAPAPRRSS